MLSETLQTAVGLAVTIVFGYLCFGRMARRVRQWRAAWELSFRRQDHGEVEYYEFESTGSDHGGANSRRGSADTSCATRRSSSQ